MATVVNGANEVLLLWRHRFITGAWGYELPSGGTGRARIRSHAAARELEEETGWRRGPMQLLLAVDPMPGISTSHHRVYWSDTAQQVREIPEDHHEIVAPGLGSADKIPDLITRGEIRSANAVAALLMLHQLRVAARP